MQKLKHNVHLVMIIAILFVTGIVFANIVVNQNKVNVSTVSADDEDEPEDENKDEDKDEDNQDDEDESAKDKVEKERESAKKANEAKREQKKQEAEDDGDADDDKDEVDDEDENDDAIEEVQDLAKDIVKMEIKLNVAGAAGVNISAMENSLDSIKDLLAQANEKATAGDVTGVKALTEEADKKLDALKKSLEAVFRDDEDEDMEEDENELEDEADEYKNKVAQFVHNLKELRELGVFDGGIGQQVSAVAQSQNDDIGEVEDSINDINERSKFAKFLIGPKYDSIAEVKTAIAENQARIKVLTDVMNQITDPAVKLVLQDQINKFQQENNKLQTFVAEEENVVSVFGWLIRMFF